MRICSQWRYAGGPSFCCFRTSQGRHLLGDIILAEPATLTPLDPAYPPDILRDHISFSEVKRPCGWGKPWMISTLHYAGCVPWASHWSPSDCLLFYNVRSTGIMLALPTQPSLQLGLQQHLEISLILELLISLLSYC